VFQLGTQDTSHSVHFSCFSLTLHSCSNFHEVHTSGSMCCDGYALHGTGGPAQWPCPRPMQKRVMPHRTKPLKG